MSVIRHLDHHRTRHKGDIDGDEADRVASSGAQQLVCDQDDISEGDRIERILEAVLEVALALGQRRTYGRGQVQVVATGSPLLICFVPGLFLRSIALILPVPFVWLDRVHRRDSRWPSLT
jgi:hypothetical protein